jgi:hypothetical protein
MGGVADHTGSDDCYSVNFRHTISSNNLKYYDNQKGFSPFHLSPMQQQPLLKLSELLQYQKTKQAALFQKRQALFFFTLI